MPSEQRKSFLLRIDRRLWELLEAWAQEELRSVNGQIEYVLRQAVQKHRRSPPEPGPGDNPARPGSAADPSRGISDDQT